MKTELKDEFTKEIAGIYAFYGRAFANGFETSPSYTAKDIENFLGYDVSWVLDQLVEEDLIESEVDDHLEKQTYKMIDEEAKADAFITWKVLRDEFAESFEKMALNFREAEALLNEQNLEYAQ
jgi:hypothetical protein